MKLHCPASHIRCTTSALLLFCSVSCFDSSKGSSDDTGDTGANGNNGAGPPVAADLLFVLDNSASMYGKLGQSGTKAAALIDAMGLNPAVDYRLAITTPTADDPASDGLDSGEGGLLIGNPIDASSSDAAAAFREQVLCQTTYWPSDIPRTSGVEECSGPPEGGLITQEYLDCVCGFDAWTSNRQGSGTEEHLESALMALCRSVENPPAACLDESRGSTFPSTTDVTNPAWLRPDSTVHVVIVTDEGDASRRIPQTGDDVDSATAYLDAFSQFDQDITVSVIGPLYDPTVDTQPRCVDGAGFGGYLVARLYDVVNQTGGLYRYIIEEDADADCIETDFSDHYAALVELVRGE